MNAKTDNSIARTFLFVALALVVVAAFDATRSLAQTGFKYSVLLSDPQQGSELPLSFQVRFNNESVQSVVITGNGDHVFQSPTGATAIHSILWNGNIGLWPGSWWWRWGPRGCWRWCLDFWSWRPWPTIIVYWDPCC